MQPDPLRPTLWRTCRVLANFTRLRLIGRLAHKQPQNVSQLAEQCDLTLPVASQSLRALEARGLLKVKRVRRRVEYRIPTRQEAGTQAGLIAALLVSLRSEPLPIEQILKLATAFTHPSRIQIYRSLQSGPKTQTQIQSVAQLSAPALCRHLDKLVRRGFLFFDESRSTYARSKHSHPLGRALASKALA